MYGGSLDKHDNVFDYESVVDYETAKRVSKLGIHWQGSLCKNWGYHYYNCDGVLDGDCVGDIIAVSRKDLTREQRKQMFHITAPTYSQILTFFLRKGFFVAIVPDVYGDDINWCWEIVDIRKEKESDFTTGLYGDNNEYPSLESALGAAINKLLSIFEEQGWETTNDELEKRLDRIEASVAQW